MIVKSQQNIIELVTYLSLKQDIIDELIKAHFTPLTLEGLQLGGKKPESSPTVLTESQLR